MLLVCADFALVSYASQITPLHILNNTHPLVLRGMLGGHLESIVSRTDFPEFLRSEDIHEIARSLEPKDLEVLGRSLEPKDLAERQIAQVVKVVAKVIEKVFKIVKNKIEQDKAVSKHYILLSYCVDCDIPLFLTGPFKVHPANRRRRHEEQARV